MSPGYLVRLAVVAAVLGLGAFLIVSQVKLRSDLAFFMPRSGTPALQLLSAKLQEGPAASLILLALSGDAPKRLADASDRLADAISASGQFHFVANGRFRAPPDVLDLLFRHRYLVDPEIRREDFSAAALRGELESALRSLGTTAGMAIAKTLPADPTNRMPRIAAHWKGGGETTRMHDVWFSKDGGRALLMTQTQASGLDFDAQQTAQQVIASAFAEARGTGTMKLEMSGPAVFAIEASRNIRGDLQTLTFLSGALVVGLLLFAFRSPRIVLALSLPLVVGVLAGITAVQGVFGQIHAISLTFGATLLGIAVDYPVHLAAHSSATAPAPSAVRRIWPTMLLGALTTVAGFIPITLSSFPGLSQMGLFASVGLVAAAATTRWLVPAFFPPARDRAGSAVPEGLLAAIDRLGALRPAAVLLVVAIVAYCAFGPVRLFADDLGKLSPVPDAAKALDRELRSAAGAPDVRYLVVIEGDSVEQVLQRGEDLRPSLDAMIAEGELSGYDMASNYLPSMRSQRKRQAALPAARDLREAVNEAQLGLPFKAGTFTPFLRDVEAAKTVPPITYETFRESGLGWLVEPLLSQIEGKWIGLIAPTGLRNPDRLADLVAGLDNSRIRYFDLKHESDQLVRGYREEALGLLGWGALVLAIVLTIGLRSAGSLVRVGTPIALSVLTTAGILVIFGDGLSLFHLLSMLLVTGVGLDYALFSNRYSGDRRERANVLRAILVCSGTTICVFAVLAASGTPVLRGIGLTVSLGTVLCLLLTPIFAIQRGSVEA